MYAATFHMWWTQFQISGRICQIYRGFGSIALVTGQIAAGAVIMAMPPLALVEDQYARAWLAMAIPMVAICAASCCSKTRIRQ